jgi:predicted AlkP superfamily pyrophosphatase or phosphodiesterase
MGTTEASNAAVSIPSPNVPRYGEASLAEVVPSVLSAFGLPGFENRLELEPVTSVALLVVDGLGWEQLLANAGAAPFLAEAADRGRPLTAGFPATTSASLGSLGTGLPPGEHGLVGYTIGVPGLDRPMNLLRWELYGFGPPSDLLAEIIPERFQPSPTVLERSRDAGLQISLVGPPEHVASGLTRAILRGARFLGAPSLPDVVTVTVEALAREPRVPVYAYHPFLDTTGHVRGVGSAEWLEHLSQVDHAVASIAGNLPHGGTLFVTADHGMVNIAEEQKVDVAEAPELLEGVRALAGEARARHVYSASGSLEDVLGAWRERMGDGMWVVPGEHAIDEGWFGPRVEDRVRPRIGDVVAAAYQAVGVFQREVDPLQAMLVGHHGSMTSAEQLVPLLRIDR